MAWIPLPKKQRKSKNFPAAALFVSEETRERKDEHQEREIAHLIEMLQGVELFHAFNHAELQMLARRLRFAPFAAGEAMTREGAEAHWLYIITRGEGEVLVRSDDGIERHVARLGPGDFFGEIGLMLGISRTATVRAVKDTDCWRLDKTAFLDILQNRPAIAEQLSHAMARRRDMYADHGLTEPDGALPKSWTVVQTPSTKPPLPIGGLRPGTIYTFQVRAYGMLGWTEWSAPVTRMCT